MEMWGKKGAELVYLLKTVAGTTFYSFIDIP
jgi:hypothetical protein